MSVAKKKHNRLAKEKSPYLLQHANNPVDWFPWSHEAFTKAKTEDKPIFLSIGYSTCHWCHVMERESFEDEEVAAYLNEHFISVKVDREERPDVDHIYMTVCQAMTEQGGWPLTVIMTPDKKPFFSGTYFPKGSKWGRPGLMDILEQITVKWQEDRQNIIDTGERITKAITPSFTDFASGDLNPSVLDKGFQQFHKSFDQQYGGFGSAPKFPTPHNLMFLLRHWKRTKDSAALDMVEKTLTAMHVGGIYDHVGFGFSRYSTDKQWLVPHFEKMLYDNALLAYTYIETYQATKNSYYRRIAEEVFTYVLRDMTDPEGGFYSAEDADSEGVEGKFYMWSLSEIIKILGEEEGKLFCGAYKITENGNFEGESILNLIHQDLERFGNEKGLTLDELNKRLDQSRDKLFREREKRIHPHKDDKVLTAWNGLMIAALAKGAQVFNEPKYSIAAGNAINFILKSLRQENGRLLARYRDGDAAYLGYIDDYAFLTWGLIEQYGATFESKYLELALELNSQLKELFWDKDNGGYYMYGSDAEELLARPKEIYDGATPSGNSVQALNLIRLARITGNSELEKDAEAQLRAFAGSVSNYPKAYSYFLMAVQFALGPTKEIVITGEEDKSDTIAMLQTLRSNFLTDTVLIFNAVGDKSKDLAHIAPFVKNQKQIDGKATAYICENYACHAPVTNLENISHLIEH